MIEKSQGYTRTEKLLAELCEGTFLKLWSYPNPYTDGHKEICDLLVVFEDQVFIFFDREKILPPLTSDDLLIHWDRWKRTVIDKQIATCYGAERYIRSGRNVYLDKMGKTKFPIKYDKNNISIHKIIIAHGAEYACKEMSENNINGSLAISYCNNETCDRPFFLILNKENPIHIFDSFNLPILLRELDTISDFCWYISEKENAIKKYDVLAYCGEEDLLANYYRNFDELNNKHYIGSMENVNGIFLEEGLWEELIVNKQYVNKKKADQISYFWDELIQRTTKNALDGTLLGNADLFNGKSAILEMAKEPRFHRRFISDKMICSMRSFPKPSGAIIRKITFVPSFYRNKAYILLQLYIPSVFTKSFDEMREFRQQILAIACGVFKNKNPNYEHIIGIALFPPMYEEQIESNPEDFVYIECDKWSSEEEDYYDEQNKILRFFETENLREYKADSIEFPE